MLGLGLLVAATAAFGVGYIGLVGAGIGFHPGADVRPMMDEPLADMITTSLVLLVLLFGPWLAVLVRDLPARDYLALRAPALRRAAGRGRPALRGSAPRHRGLRPGLPVLLLAKVLSAREDFRE